jgi:tRNA threonylcarbamoyladenosine biosynthesis protein TsaE
MNSSEKNVDLEIISHSPEETIVLGSKLGGALSGGEVIALTGPLGSGKTHLIKGIAAGLGAGDTNRVNSPTFVIINQYTGRDGALDIYHIDAYRLGSVAEFEMLGFDDLCTPESVVLIEWADRVQPALENIDTIQIHLAHIDQNQRMIHIRYPRQKL